MEFLIECWKEVGISKENIHEFLEVMVNPAKEEIWDKKGLFSEGKMLPHWC